MKHVVICPPKYFDIEYEINPWMHVERKVNKEKAWEAYNELKRIYVSLGMMVDEMDPIDGLPDMVYTADCGHVEGDTFIRANFRYPERRPEAFVAAEWMQKHFGFKTVTLPEGIFFEGHGDLIPAGDMYFMGWGKRSMIEAAPYIQELTGKTVIPIELVDPYYYHLDTCFTAITPEIAIINPTSFTEDGLKKIYSHFKKVIAASVADHQIFGCNLVVVDKNIIIAKGISHELRTQLNDLGFTIHEVDSIEYRKGGGSVKCMTFEFEYTGTPVTLSGTPAIQTSL